ncbi:hypothetical protein BBP40_004219 [Aspergillus hancockii]|nr:hypothetical protein BBP40_004219 [Aspergillus hancockii]
MAHCKYRCCDQPHRSNVGQETCRIVAAVKNLPAEIKHLQTELQEVEFPLENIHRYCTKYQVQQPDIALQKNSPTRQIYSTLEKLRVEYSEMSDIVAQHVEAQKSRSLSTFTVVHTASPIFECVRSNDVQGQRKLLTYREATPTVRNAEKESISSRYANSFQPKAQTQTTATHLSPPNPTSPNTTNPNTRDGANTICHIRNAFWYRATHYRVPKSTLNKLLRLFVTAGRDINSVALGGNPLHFTVGDYLPSVPIIDESEIPSLINPLICLGCDIEYRNADGLTPLLFNSCIP